MLHLSSPSPSFLVHGTSFHTLCRNAAPCPHLLGCTNRLRTSLNGPPPSPKSPLSLSPNSPPGSLVPAAGVSYSRATRLIHPGHVRMEESAHRMFRAPGSRFSIITYPALPTIWQNLFRRRVRLVLSGPGHIWMTRRLPVRSVIYTFLSWRPFAA